MTGGSQNVQEWGRALAKGEEPRIELLPDHTPIVTIQTIYLHEGGGGGSGGGREGWSAVEGGRDGVQWREGGVAQPLKLNCVSLPPLYSTPLPHPLSLPFLWL